MINNINKLRQRVREIGSLYEVICEEYNVVDDDAMPLMNEYDRLINEGYKYLSVLANLSDEDAEFINDIESKIDPDDTYREENDDKDRPHVTVKYGIDSCDIGDLRDLLKDVSPIKCTLGLLSYFPSDDYDVLKIAVDSPDLVDLNALLDKNFAHIDTFPEYNPHITVAYLEKGCIDKYVDPYPRQGEVIEFDAVWLSNRDGKHTEVKLGGDSPINEATPKSTEERVHRHKRVETAQLGRVADPVVKKKGDNDPRSTPQGRANFKGWRKRKQDEWKKKHPEKFTEAIDLFAVIDEMPINEIVAAVQSLEYPGRLLQLFGEYVDDEVGGYYQIITESFNDCIYSREFYYKDGDIESQQTCSDMVLDEARGLSIIRPLVWVECNQVGNIISMRAIADIVPSNIFTDARIDKRAILIDELT